MAKRTEPRTFNISVIGLSGTEKEKGLTGVGKSCLCNRFMRPLANDYHMEHISVLSQSDFGGRVINNDHFLYWGEISKTDEGVDHTFHVIEQTEFTDDVSFQPFKTGKHEPYSKRCISTKVQSAEKLMYICKEQLGMETDSAYEQKLMPDGKLNIDGFMVVFDVSTVHNRPIERQVEFVSQILQSLQKIRKPVVLATTKHDEAVDRFCKEAGALVTRSKLNIPIVETSALDNINVELAFMTLAHLIDGTKMRKKIIPFADAYRARKDILEVATKAYKKLLNTQVTDPKASWTIWKKKFMKESDYNHYVELFGTESAVEHFRKHTMHLKEQQLRQRELRYLDSLPTVLQYFLTSLDVISDKSWISCQNYIFRHPDMPKFFINMCGEGQTWKDCNWLDSDDKRLPFDLLKSSEAETTFKNHVNALQEQHKKLELKKKFKDFLEENKQVKPGKPISETYINFVGKECYNSLNEREREEVYEQHQVDLRMRAKQDFQELMWEKSEIFTELNPSVRLTQDDLKIITNALQNDPRYQLLDHLEEDRKVMILNHLGFIQCPSKERCYFREQCVEAMAQKILSHRPARPDISESAAALKGIEQPFYLVLLGKDGLASNINQEIRHLCVEDEYNCQDILFSLDYRPIDGDVTQEQHAFVTPTFKPHGCVCVYNSHHTFEYVQMSLEQTWLSDLAREDGLVLDRLRFVIIQFHNPMLSEREINQLREQGQQFADNLQCKFYYIPSEPEGTERRKFIQAQTEHALQSIIRPAASALLSCWQSSDYLEADMRIAVCMMCGDKFPMEFALAPLLNQEFFRVVNKDNGQWLVDIFLDDLRVRLNIMLTSYHGANLMRDTLFHGYVLIYSAQRQASLSTMRAFAAHLQHQIPILVLAIADSIGTALLHDENVTTLISEGSSVAEKLKAYFMTTSHTFQHQHSVFTPFFNDAWVHREDTENFFIRNLDPPSPPLSESNPNIDKRPPAPLPKPNDLYHTTKSSTSNRCVSPDCGCQSTEDSEPLYDHLVFPNQYHSDSEQERASSPSPPPISSPTDYEIISSIAAQTNGEHLIKPSEIKSRRNKYVGPDEDDFEELLDTSLCDNPSCQQDDTVWTNNQFKPIRDKACRTRLEPGPLNRRQFEPVAKVITRNITNTRNMPNSSRVQAPLAVPEPIEIADYGTVKDALLQSPTESDYALVEDALPAGKVHRIKSTRKKDHKDKQKHKLYGLPDLVWVPVRSQSPSDGSEGTGDELLVRRKPRSFKKKCRSPTMESSTCIVSPPLSDSDNVGSPPHRYEENLYETICPLDDYNQGTLSKYDTLDDYGDLTDGSNWKDKFHVKIRHKESTTDRAKKKEEKKRQKEEEKKLKEQQKLQKKIKKKDGKIAGASQSGLVLEDYQMSTKNHGVPLFVERCVEFIDEEGMTAEGIYRVPGNRAQVELLLNKFQEDTSVDIMSLDIQVNAVATALKGFFNDLMEALFPSNLINELTEASEGKDGAGFPEKSSRLLALRGVLKKLPPTNYEVLKYLITHFSRISRSYATNNMDSKNLARCWWPTLIRMDFQSYGELTYNSRIPLEILQTLIEQCGFFFHGENEV
ncbi:rho GTPase-activating protein 190 isoform X18 [Octopus bimaculoides]|uniref:rho GTPase-activating protein 190 isoform X18 n=1 Tax=Octopus bimaculoides TaxID=37653 RepID=UPI0022E837A2|nr:rho GTPase-activating protein 190 isoform X18 [Octopus bimaculoides]